MNPSFFRTLFLLPFVAVLLADIRAEKPTVSQGVLTLKVGDYSATFLESASWTLDTLDYKGVALITPTGANQTVLKLLSAPGLTEKDQWIGTKHGREVVEAISLNVDGQPYDLGAAFHAPEGSRYELLKVSKFGPFRARWVVRLDAGGLHESVTFEQIEDDTSKVAFIYVFMHCWNPRMMDWLAVLKDGSQLSERFPSEASKSLQKDISMLAVYSADEETGAVLTYPKAYEGMPNKQSFLNNFPERHNKLYLTVSKQSLTKEPYTCRVQGFTAKPDAWAQTALDLSSSQEAQ